jgi:RsiW-degrading membrane proteinase PrsW (M82 family)
VTFLVAIISGPFAILGAFFSGGQSAFGIAMVTVFGPMAEEVLKSATAMWVVEKRPFYFISRIQIAICLLASALVFAAVENVLYLTLYIDNPGAGIILWRWTICVGLHMSCSFIASFGLMRIWGDCMQNRTRPRISLGAPFLITAVIVHGLYNTIAVFMEATGFEF